VKRGMQDSGSLNVIPPTIDDLLFLRRVSIECSGGIVITPSMLERGVRAAHKYRLEHRPGKAILTEDLVVTILQAALHMVPAVGDNP